MHKKLQTRIPEIIRKSGNECEFVILSEAEYRQALLQKLIEEAGEAAEAHEQDLVAELADLFDVEKEYHKKVQNRIHFRFCE